MGWVAAGCNVGCGTGCRNRISPICFAPASLCVAHTLGTGGRFCLSILMMPIDPNISAISFSVTSRGRPEIYTCIVKVRVGLREPADAISFWIAPSRDAMQAIHSHLPHRYLLPRCRSPSWRRATLEAALEEENRRAGAGITFQPSPLLLSHCCLLFFPCVPSTQSG
jgi:hypothetical protein